MVISQQKDSNIQTFETLFQKKNFEKIFESTTQFKVRRSSEYIQLLAFISKEKVKAIKGFGLYSLTFCLQEVTKSQVF